MEHDETPQLTQNEKSMTCIMDNSVTSRCIKTVITFQQHFCLQHRDESSLITTENWEHYQIQQQLDVPSMHAGNRCRHEMNKEGSNARHSRLVAALPSQTILRTWIEREISDSEGDASQVVTQKRKHCIYTHFPKDRNCDMCLRTKMTRAPCRRRDKGSVPRLDDSGSQSPQRRK